VNTEREEICFLQKIPYSELIKEDNLLSNYMFLIQYYLLIEARFVPPGGCPPAEPVDFADPGVFPPAAILRVTFPNSTVFTLKRKRKEI
jgi:hypothetical protein